MLRILFLAWVEGLHLVRDRASLAQLLLVPFIQLVILANAATFANLECRASPRELRRRITARHHAGRDASEADRAVLDDQLRMHDPLDRAERRAAVTVDTEGPIRFAKLAERLRRT